MSTSDADGTRRPDGPADGTTPDARRADETTTLEPVTAPAAATSTTPASPATPETTDDAPDPAAGPPVAPPVEPATDTGRHATVRPVPSPPPPAPVRTSTRGAAPAEAPVAAPTGPDAAAERTTVLPPAPATQPEVAPTTTMPATAPHTTPTPVVAGAAAGAAAPAPATQPAPPAEPATAPSARQDELFPEPNAPRSTSAGTHVLGVLVGLVLTPIAAGVLLLGQARILEAQAPGWDATLDVTGIVLVTLGLLALGWVSLLAVWTPAAPITGGTVLTVLGIAALAAPGVVRTQTLDLLDSEGWRTTITQVTVAGTSGTLVTAGFLILLTGIAASVSTRRGVRLGAFRERHR